MEVIETKQKCLKIGFKELCILLKIDPFTFKEIETLPLMDDTYLYITGVEE